MSKCTARASSVARRVTGNFVVFNDSQVLARVRVGGANRCGRGGFVRFKCEVVDGSSCHLEGARWPQVSLILIVRSTSPCHDRHVRRVKKLLIWVSGPVFGVLGG